MLHRVLETEQKWTLCRSGGADPDPLDFENYAKAADYLARRGLRIVGRDTEVRVLYYASETLDD
ncbi:MAG: hypothetical protein RIM84_05225 [Alphaproteobacteria bacterium]